MVSSFKDFMANIITEELHPELQGIAHDSNHRGLSKQTRIVNKVKELSARGEKTGIEGNMPQGSARAYLQHHDPDIINLDNKPAAIKSGTKIAIKSKLDKYHTPEDHEGMHLGAMQNRAEAGDHWVNQTYRVLKDHPHEEGKFVSNKENGIFPPLLHHDDANHQWSHVGHAEDINKKGFKELTKNKDYPNGISHEDFVEALTREHDKNNGKYWPSGEDHEEKMDDVLNHPLTQKFNDYHGNTGNPPHDLGQIKNLGVFHHPDGSKHIVARDHGFDTDVAHAYRKAKMKLHGRNMDKIFR